MSRWGSEERARGMNWTAALRVHDASRVIVAFYVGIQYLISTVILSH